MRSRIALAASVVLVLVACGDDAGPLFTTTSTTSPADSTTTTVPASTTAASSTTTSTAAPTTSTLALGPVMGLEITLGGGSEEVAVTWDPNPEPHVDHYDVFFSETPGGTYEFVRSIVDDSLSPIPGRPGYIDHPRAQTVGMTCYVVRAVGADGGEGPLSDEECFDPYPGPPSQVLDVVVGLGGGSGEVSVTWAENPEGDVDYYDVYFSQTPGGAYAYTRSVQDDSASPIPGRPGFVDFPRDQTVGMTCYRVQAIDHDLEVGPLSAEACFQP